MKKQMDCHRVVCITKGLSLGGFALALLAIPIGAWCSSETLMLVLWLLGVTTAICGYVLNVRRAVCPHCGTFLGCFPRMAGKVPNFCPECGEKIETSA